VALLTSAAVDGCEQGHAWLRLRSHPTEPACTKTDWVPREMDLAKGEIHENPDRS
jgi:hypothetical protein